MSDKDCTHYLQQSIKQALSAATPINIEGGGSKSFYGGKPGGELLKVSQHRGIVNYYPSELVLTARAGTPLREIQQTLAEHGQMLAFEPPAFGESATLGGAIACGLSGSRRPFAGSVRDFVLGCQIIDGQGEVLNFGGEVMKNVAGYDVSRLMVGAMGTLGLLLQVSLKVLPLPLSEKTTQLKLDYASARQKMLYLARQSLPISAMSYDGDLLRVRCSGPETALRVALARIGGEELVDATQYWQNLNEHRLSFFSQEQQPLWRVCLPPAAAELPLTGDCYEDWGGGLRWLRTDESADKVFSAAVSAQGQATLFRSGDRGGNVFQPMSGQLFLLQQQVKQVFDPQKIFNPFRLNPSW
jgi:glycolate dehydrogenase FAD-binding subunit